MVPFRKPEKQPEEIPVKNNSQVKTPARLYILLGAMTVLLFAAAGVTTADSLLLKEQGSFFVGGRTIFTDALTGSTTGFLGTGINTGNITVDQMYVQYQIPEGADSHVPVVMVHGCCLSSKSYETTPDGAWGGTNIFCASTAPYICPTKFRAPAPASTQRSTTKLNWASAPPATC